ncbi:MAG: hypothetical protein WDW38_009541 [Sanguina aurantia]
MLERLLAPSPTRSLAHSNRRRRAAAAPPQTTTDTATDSAAWSRLHRCPAERYDVLLVLRKEAMPQAHRALSRPRVARHSQPSCLTACREASLPPPGKRARAFLHAFPEQVIAGKGPDKLLPELLIGFDPVARMTACLEERYGHLATFCFDALGGSVIGVKWEASAFLLSGSRVATLHTSLRCGLTTTDESTAGKMVPNVIQILSEWQEMGLGLVQDTEMPHASGC